MEGLRKRHVPGGLDILYGVGQISIKAGGQVLSGFSVVGSRLGLIFGWDFVVVVCFVAVLNSHKVIWFGLCVINKPLCWYVQSLKPVGQRMGWMCFYFRIAQIKYITGELVCGWCFLRTAIQISFSVSHDHPSKGNQAQTQQNHKNNQTLPQPQNPTKPKTKTKTGR